MEQTHQSYFRGKGMTELSSEFNIKNEFIAGYIGTHGMAHGIDSIVEAAVYLQKYPEIRILLAAVVQKESGLNMKLRISKLRTLYLSLSSPKRKLENYGVCKIYLSSILKIYQYLKL